jgi:hypothetical protein
MICKGWPQKLYSNIISTKKLGGIKLQKTNSILLQTIIYPSLLYSSNVNTYCPKKKRFQLFMYLKNINNSHCYNGPQHVKNKNDLHLVMKI